MQRPAKHDSSSAGRPRCATSLRQSRDANVGSDDECHSPEVTYCAMKSRIRYIESAPGSQSRSRGVPARALPVAATIPFVSSMPSRAAAVRALLGLRLTMHRPSRLPSLPPASGHQPWFCRPDWLCRAPERQLRPSANIRDSVSALKLVASGTLRAPPRNKVPKITPEAPPIEVSRAIPIALRRSAIDIGGEARAWLELPRSLGPCRCRGRHPRSPCRPASGDPALSCMRRATWSEHRRRFSDRQFSFAHRIPSICSRSLLPACRSSASVPRRASSG